MKRIPIFVAFLSFTLLVVARGDANPQQEQQVLAVVKEVRAQQLAIAENQAKIDAKLAAVAESLRLARIYSIRGK